MGNLIVSRSVAGFGNTIRPGKALAASVANTRSNGVVLVAVPPGVVTEIKPLTLLVPPGTTKVIVIPLTTVKFVTANVPMRTAVAPVRFVPVRVTVAPGPPVIGEKLVMVGAGVVTVKVAATEVPPPGAGLGVVNSEW